MSVVLDPDPMAAPPELSAAEAAQRVREILGDTARYGVFPPNEGMLAVVEEIARNRKPSFGAEGPSSVELIREARAGAMWDDAG